MQTNDNQIGADNLLDDVLKMPPTYSLPDNFAEMVAAKAVRRFAWQQYFREFMVYVYAFLGLVAVTVALAFIWLGADWQVWKQFLVNNTSLVISLHVLGLFVLFADKVLLQYFFFRYSRRKAEVV